MEWSAAVIDQNLIDRTGTSMVLSSARPLGFIALFPVISQHNLPQGVLISSIAFCFSVPMMPYIFSQSGVFPDMARIDLILLFVKELILGAILMLPLAAPFWAASTAGAIVETSSGLGAAAEGKEFGGAFSDLYIWMLVALLLTQGGFYQLILRNLYDSYHVWPVYSHAPEFSEQFWLYLLGVLDRVMLFGWMMALPLLATFFLTDVITGVAYKYTPQFNPMMESSGYKVTLLTIVMIPFCMMYLQLGHQYLIPLAGALQELGGQVVTPALEVP